MQAQPFSILVLLLERAGDVVTREELRTRLWPGGTFVDFDHGINTAVKKLRRALRDSPERPRFVETVAKRGYRWIGPLESAAETSVANASPTRAAAADTSDARLAEATLDLPRRGA